MSLLSIKVPIRKKSGNLFNDSRIIKMTIGQLGRVFANGPGDPGSIPGRVLQKSKKMVLDISLINPQYYKV